MTVSMNSNHFLGGCFLFIDFRLRAMLYTWMILRFINYFYFQLDTKTLGNSIKESFFIFCTVILCYVILTMLYLRSALSKIWKVDII